MRRFGNYSCLFLKKMFNQVFWKCILDVFMHCVFGVRNGSCLSSIVKLLIFSMNKIPNIRMYRNFPIAFIMFIFFSIVRWCRFSFACLPHLFIFVIILVLPSFSILSCFHFLSLLLSFFIHSFFMNFSKFLAHRFKEFFRSSRSHFFIREICVHPWTIPVQFSEWLGMPFDRVAIVFSTSFQQITCNPRFVAGSFGSLGKCLEFPLSGCHLSIDSFNVCLLYTSDAADE